MVKWSLMEGRYGGFQRNNTNGNRYILFKKIDFLNKKTELLMEKRDLYKKKLYKKLNTKTIKDDNLQFYMTKYPQLGFPVDLKPLSLDIQPYQYHTAMQIGNGYKNDRLIKIAKELSGKIIKEYNDDNDEIIMSYIRCKTNIVIITIWEDMVFDIEELSKEYGNLYYIKKINLNDKAAKNLIYQLYADTQI